MYALNKSLTTQIWFPIRSGKKSNRFVLTFIILTDDDDSDDEKWEEEVRRREDHSTRRKCGPRTAGGSRTRNTGEETPRWDLASCSSPRRSCLTNRGRWRKGRSFHTTEFPARCGRQKGRLLRRSDDDEMISRESATGVFIV